MPTVVLDPPPVELEELIERRHRLGQDVFDEVWNGVLHMKPAPHGRHAKLAQQHPTAALVVEIVSSGDETYEKLGFYAARRVDEVLIVDPQRREVRLLRLAGDGYEPVEHSELVELGPAGLSRQIDWP